MIKQVIVLRKDLNMRKGKMVAQGAHASMAAILGQPKPTDVPLDMADPLISRLAREINLRRPDVAEWLDGAFTKICVSVNSEEELRAIYYQALDAKIPCSFIVDNGKTEFDGVKTPTAVAVGPANDEIINKITGHLSLL